MALEGAGLAIGVASLASLFNTTVECFQYVQIGRDFGIDFQSAELELSFCRLRVLRWGEAVGLTTSSNGASALPSEVCGSIDDVRLAKKTLGQINALFEKIDDASKAYNTSTSPSSTTHGLDRDLDQRHMDLCQIMENVALERQKALPIRKKLKWAVHGKPNLDRLLSDVKGLTDSLTGTFKATQLIQQNLAEIEVKEVKDDNLPHFEAASRGHDPLLNEAVEKRMKTLGSYRNQHFKVSGGAKVSNGHFVDSEYKGPVMTADHIYQDYNVSGEGSRVLNGTKFGGKDPFD